MFILFAHTSTDDLPADLSTSSHHHLGSHVIVWQISMVLLSQGAGGWLGGWASQKHRRNTCPPAIQSHNCNCATFEDVAFVQPNKSINLRRLCHGLLNYRLTVPKSWPSTTTGFDTGVWSAHRSAGTRKTTTTAAAPSERDETGHYLRNLIMAMVVANQTTPHTLWRSLP